MNEEEEKIFVAKCRELDGKIIDLLHNKYDHQTALSVLGNLIVKILYHNAANTPREALRAFSMGLEVGLTLLEESAGEKANE